MKTTGFVAACLAAAAVGAPTTKRGTEKGYTVAQNELALPGHKIGTLAYHRSLTKFGGAISDMLSQAHQAYMAEKVAGGSGSTLTQPGQYDMEYLTPVTVGGRTLNLNIDTGSSDLWVFSDEMDASQTNGHEIYQTKGTGFTGSLVQSSSWSISYGDASTAHGNVYTDNVDLAGINAPKQAVEAAIMVSPNLAADTASDGIFGFGFSNINNVKPQPQLTWFDNVKGGLEKPIFAAALKHQAPGFYDFGYLNSSRYTGDIAYSPVSAARGYWEIQAGGYAISGQQFPTPMAVIADTGTSVIMATPDIVNNFYYPVRSAVFDEYAGGVKFQCTEQLPDFSLIVNGQQRTAAGSFLNYGPLGQDGEWCFGGIQDNGGLEFTVLGDTFLKSQYVVFDAGTPQLGFAQAST